ncbi:hypothetical protein NDK47_17795 [Brevibacillus ruminantium]|uniref:Uncharacterized protein n=1 Tax=Brevibacillus ruminantium TaxID=2950604 RepID=A0ABY4WA01_9BACL|nr:hypothetical protein [Brevibacillus ruminantium]USG64003.1 hypothetical protein NDK47_17795 [Brevibacillus ruminantium]
MQDQVTSMAYRQSIIDRLDRQTEKGIKKYGETIDKSGHLTNVDQAFEYLAEELTDGLVYNEHLRQMFRERELKLIEALRWYANYSQYERQRVEVHIDVFRDMLPVIWDGGQRARDTLKELGAL